MSRFLLKNSIIKVFILFSFIFSMHASAKSMGDLLTTIQGTDASAQYLYFLVDDKSFLANKKEDGSYKVWRYTNLREWQPISNTGAWDGFAAAENIFSSVTVTDGTISFGDIVGTSALAEADALKSKTFTIGWYFWKKNGEAFLLKPRENGEVSIWNYTADKRWQPMHNAPAFDNFPSRPKTFTNVSFDVKTLSIGVGAIDAHYNIKLNAVLSDGKLPAFDASKNHYNGGDKISYNDQVCTAKWWISQSPAAASYAWACVSASGDNSPKAFDSNKDHYNKGDIITYKGGKCTANWWISSSPEASPYAWACTGQKADAADEDNGALKPFDPNKNHYNKGDKISTSNSGETCVAKWWINKGPTDSPSAWTCTGKKDDAKKDDDKKDDAKKDDDKKDDAKKDDDKKDDTTNNNNGGTDSNTSGGTDSNNGGTDGNGKAQSAFRDNGKPSTIVYPAAAAWDATHCSQLNAKCKVTNPNPHYARGEKVLWNGGVCTASYYIDAELSPVRTNVGWTCTSISNTVDSDKVKADNSNADSGNNDDGTNGENTAIVYPAAVAYDAVHCSQLNAKCKVDNAVPHYERGEKVLYNGGTCTANQWTDVSPATNTPYGKQSWTCTGGSNVEQKEEKKGDENAKITYPAAVAYDAAHCSQLNAKCKVANADPHYERGEKVLYNGGTCTANQWTDVSPALNSDYSNQSWTCTGGKNDEKASSGIPAFDPNHGPANSPHYNKGEKVSYDGKTCTAQYWINVSPAINSYAWVCEAPKNSDGTSIETTNTVDYSYRTTADFTGTVPDTKTLFVPFADVTSWPPYKMADGEKSGIKNFALGFINSGGTCSPRWGNYDSYTMENVTLKLDIQIKEVIANGGQVMLSFGGASAGANELAKVCTTPALLAAAYQEAVDKTGAKMIDFDIEGAQSRDVTSITRRMKALKIFQTKNPDIGVSFTLATMPYGLLKDSGLMVVKKAIAEGVEFDFINLMIMDYGASFPANVPGKHKMADYGIQALKSVNLQLKAAIEGERKNGRFSEDSNQEYYNRLGATPMIGRNDTLNEYFYRSDIVKLREFADAVGVKVLSMWSLNRDKPIKVGGNPKASLMTDTKLSQGSGIDEYGTGDKYEFAKLLKRKSK